jgi:apolipoprotein D and lipocalin family protein
MSSDPSRPRRASRAAAPLALAAVTLTLAVAAGPALAQAPRLPTVPSLDPARYAGTWHEIARLPNRFQAQCAAEVTATYAPRPDGTIGVTNRCRTANGALDEAEGVAEPQDGTNAKLKVTFLPSWLRWLPVGRGDYWVIDLDPDYRWVMVGEPKREFLWVLAREKALPADTLETLLGRAREAGFPVDRVVTGPQKPPAKAD